MTNDIKELVYSFRPVSLNEMDSVLLMNRYDTKFLFHVSRVPELLGIMLKDYRVLEIQKTRISDYNTIYLDTPEYFFYNQHVTGRKNRLKVRFRKYMPSGTTFLEIKRKNRKRKTTKWRIEHDIVDGCCDEIAYDFINKHIPFDSSSLKPSLSSNFNRITLVRFDRPERITLDLDLSFRSFDGKTRSFPHLAIAELKSEGIAVRSPFYDICRDQALFPVSFSKYCTGIALLNDLPKKNLLKEKLLLIKRIGNEFNRALIA